MGRSKRPQFAEEVDTATGGEVRRFRPSHVKADHASNQRFAPYDTMPELVPFIGDKCCFRPEQIEARLSSFLELGQIDAVEVSRSNTGHPHLEVGFLRHCAFLLAEVRGIVDDIPGAKGLKVSGIRAEVVAAAASQSDHEAAARRNYAENNERAELSPVDRALYFKRRLAALRDDGSTMTREDLAKEIGKHVDYINKHLRLFTDLKPDELLQVHEGKLPYTVALNRAKNRGSGKSRGPRGANTGLKHSAMKRAISQTREGGRKFPAKELSPDQIVALFALVAGVDDPDAEDVEIDDVVQDWVDYLDAPKDAKRGSKQRKGKGAPPKVAAKPSAE